MKTPCLVRWLRELGRRVFLLFWFPLRFLNFPYPSLESLRQAFLGIVIHVIDHIASTDCPVTVMHPIFGLSSFQLEKGFALALDIELGLLLRRFFVRSVEAIVRGFECGCFRVVICWEYNRVLPSR